jgi:hypothetical protein
MNPEPIFAYAKLNSKVLPLDRGDLFEDPLSDALQENGYAEVTGGGTMQSEGGEIDFCGIDIDLHDVENGVPFICGFLSDRGAPKGSALEYELNGERVEVPFGVTEGMGIYLNGTDLPDEVYQTCNINVFIEELHNLLGDCGAMLAHWTGPAETALYFYGASFDEMQDRIREYVGIYPLAQKARIVRIA